LVRQQGPNSSRISGWAASIALRLAAWGSSTEDLANAVLVGAVHCLESTLEAGAAATRAADTRVMAMVERRVEAGTCVHDLVANVPNRRPVGNPRRGNGAGV
jgi:hypothetical protein